MVLHDVDPLHDNTGNGLGSAGLMKAAVLFGKDDIRYCDYPAPVLDDGMVKVKVHFSGICGSDVPRVLGHAAYFYPIILGHEFSGEVVETGKGVKRLRVGDRIAGAPLLPCFSCDDCQKGNYASCKNYKFIGSLKPGSFAEYVAIPEMNAIVIDQNITYEEAVMFEPATVAIHGLDRANFHGGENVAILGSGTIGSFVLQWAKIFGAKKVVVFDKDNHRLELAKRLGADETINTTEPDAIDKAMQCSGGKGYAYVFETAGQPDTIGLSFEMAANKASVCLIGTPSREVIIQPKLWEKINRKEFSMTGSWMSYSPAFPGKEWSLVAHYLSTGDLKIDKDMIFRTFPLSEVAQAFELFKSEGLVKGKILLACSE